MVKASVLLEGKLPIVDLSFLSYSALAGACEYSIGKEKVKSKRQSFWHSRREVREQVARKRNIEKMQREMDYLRRNQDRDHRMIMRLLGEISWIEIRLNELEKGRPGYKPAECKEGSEEYEQIKAAVEKTLGVPICMFEVRNNEGHGSINIKF